MAVEAVGSRLPLLLKRPPLSNTPSQLPFILKKNEIELVAHWSEEQTRVLRGKISVAELKSQCQEFMLLVMQAAQTDTENLNGQAWMTVKKLLTEVSKSRSHHGFTPSETAMFVFSLKKPLFNVLRKEFASEPAKLADEIWAVTLILDQLGLHTMEIYQKTREEIISRQQQEMLELSTPVVKLWDGILALPMIGTLDSSRTQIVMESLLQKIMETESVVAIIDITGVPTVDTLVAQHLIKTVTAARLMGAECMISGIRPQIVATIVHLGVDLGSVTTKATLADAFVLALKRTGRTVTKAGIQDPARV
jgi:rsbT co-antagonist protein RsbR